MYGCLFSGLVRVGVSKNLVGFEDYATVVCG